MYFMKKNSKIILYILLFVFVILSWGLFAISNGYARDYNFYKYDIVRYFNLLQIPLWIFFFKLLKNNEKFNYIAKIYIILSVILIGTNTIITFENFKYVKNYDMDNAYNYDIDNIDNIDNIEVMDILEKKETAIVYFYREDCPYCEEIDNPLKEYLNNNSISNIKAYSTNSNYRYKEEIVESYQIKSVPVLIEVSNGEVVDRKYFDDIAEEIGYIIN